MKSFGIRHPWRWVSLAFVAMVLTGLTARHGLLPHPLKGEPLPKFLAEPLEGMPYIFEAEPGRVIIVEFWASWCVPCMVSLPRLEKVQAWIREEGVNAEIQCINVGEPPARAAEVWSAKQFTMPLLLDPHRIVADRFRVTTFPTTMLAVDGRVEHVDVGTRNTHAVQIKKRIVAALERAPAPDSREP